MKHSYITNALIRVNDVENISPPGFDYIEHEEGDFLVWELDDEVQPISEWIESQMPTIQRAFSILTQNKVSGKVALYLDIAPPHDLYCHCTFPSEFLKILSSVDANLEFCTWPFEDE